MTEKRYFLHKHLIKNDVIHDNICHKWLKGEELESDMNTLYNKYSSLKKENEQLKQIAGFLKNDNAEDILNVLNSQENRIWELKQENEQLQYFIQELTTKGTAKIHLANGSIYKVNAILNDFKSDDLND